MPARFRLFHSSYIRRTTALFSSVDIGVPPSTLSRVGHTKNRRTTLTVVAGFTCCSPQPGWPGRGKGQKAEGKGGATRRARLLVTWGQALEGESSSVLTLWPGD